MIPIRHYLLLTLVLLFGLSANAQQKLTFRIADFELAEEDMTARNPQYEKIDPDGARYAIIKVTSDNPEDNLRAYKFDFGYLESFVEMHDDILWLYVRQNAKKVSIRREGYTTISQYNLGITIQQGRTYRMLLSAQMPVVSTQMLMFQVKPEDSEAVVLIKEEGDKGKEEVFGTIDENGQIAKSLPLGVYTYKVVSKICYTSEGRIVLSDPHNTHNEEVILKSNYGEVSLSVNSDADIFVNNEFKGKHLWKGKLRAGTYKVECRQTGHIPTVQSIKVEENKNSQINLKAPTPINGTLEVVSKPLGAAIYVDGKKCGISPQKLKLLIGEHEILLRKDGYVSTKQNVVVEEGKTKELNIAVNVLDPQATDDIKGINKKNIIYQKPSCFYLMAGAQVGHMMGGIGATLGGYIKNFNIEAFYLYGLVGSEDIVWQNGTYSSFEYKYYAMTYGGKIGYGVDLLKKKRLRFTPQTGLRIVSIWVKGGDSNGYALSVPIAFRADYAFNKHFGVFLTPEMDIAVKKSHVFGQLADVSSKIKHWGTGFNVTAGIRFSF